MVNNILTTIAIIQARTGSSRFPDKVLKKIDGRPILQYVVDYLKNSKLIDKIVIATTSLNNDDEIELLAKKLKIPCFRGNVNDVLNRFYECAKVFHADIILRVTADDPLIDPNIIDQIIQKCKSKNCDYASNVIHRTFPLGFTACEAIKFHTLEKLNNDTLDPLSREHVTYHIIKNPNLYRIQEVQADAKLSRPNWRLTIDFPEDFLLIEKIISTIGKEKEFISYGSLVKFLDQNTDLLKINKRD